MMMKMKSVFAGVLAVAMVALSACGDDDTSPRSQFKFDGESTVSLSDGNLYLVESGSFGTGHEYRNYFISDGTYEGGDGSDLTDYNDATYVLAVRLAVPEGEDVTTGDYPLYDNIEDLPLSGSLAWLSLETEDDVEFQTPNGTIDGDEVSISGGVDDGDRMTIRFSGTLTNSTGIEDEDSEGKIYFKGEVQDVRPTPVRKASAPARGAVK
jgi:hypothetical protein